MLDAETSTPNFLVRGTASSVRTQFWGTSRSSLARQSSPTSGFSLPFNTDNRRKLSESALNSFAPSVELEAYLRLELGVLLVLGVLGLKRKLLHWVLRSLRVSLLLLLPHACVFATFLALWIGGGNKKF